MERHIHSAADLTRAGYTSRMIADDVAAGRLIRIRRGWYATWEADPAEVAAIRRGGRIGCVTGAARYGVWVPRDQIPHLIPPKHIPRRPGSQDHTTRAALPSTAVYPLVDCLAQAIRHHAPETALMVVESATNKGLVLPSHAELLWSEATVHDRRTLGFFHPASESGSETRVRLWFQQRNIPVLPQVRIDGVGRCDLLVGRSLIVECDSHEHHSSKEQQAKDRRRDPAAHALGYETIRLSYPQIHTDWATTQEYLARVIATRRHLEPPSPI